MIGKVILMLVVPALVYASSRGYTPEELSQIDVNTMECPKNGSIFLLLPDFTDDCSDVFYMCVHGGEVKFNCPDPLVFHFKDQTCDWKHNAVCTQRNGDLESSGDGPGEPNIENTPEVEGPSDIFNSVLDCQNAESASKQVPYPQDCQKYWKCEKGEAQIHTCSDGLFFNAMTEQCDYEANAHCEVHPEDELQGEYIVFK